MPLFVGVNGSWQASSANIWISGERKDIKNAWIGVNGAWRQFITEPPVPPIVDVAPTSLFGYRVGPGEITTTLTSTATDELGTATGFSWRRTSGAAAISATNPNAANTGFTATIGGNVSISATYVCDVTGPGGVTTSEEITVDFVSYEAPPEFDDTDILQRLDNLENPP